MEFTVTINAQKFSVSTTDGSMFLVSTDDQMYILYKERKWCCAEPMSALLLDAIGRAIDAHKTNAGIL